MAVYCFDGTGCHRNLRRADGRIRRINGGGGSNVAKLSAILDERVHYFGGVGNPVDFAFWSQPSELAYGMGCKDLVDRMLVLLDEQLAAGDDVIDLIGFGRGASQAVELVHRLADRIRAGTPTPGIRFLALLDQIGATGAPVHGGRDQYLRQQLPTGIRIEHCVSAYAWDEARLQLQCIWQPQDGAGLDVGQLHQEIFRGVHSDIGGGYEATGLSDLVLRWLIEHATQAGLVFQAEDDWAICGEPLQLRPDPEQLPHRVTDPDYFPKPRRFPDWLLQRARTERGFPLGDWHRVIIKNRQTGREKYLMNLDPFIEDRPRPAGYRIVQPRDWFPKKPRPQARMRIDRRLSEEDILALMAEDGDLLAG